MQNAYLQVGVNLSALAHAESRIELILSSVDQQPPDLLSVDLESVAMSLLRLTAREVDVNSLDRRLAAILAIDFDAFEKAITYFEDTPLENAKEITRVVEPGAVIEALREYLERLKRDLPQLEATEVVLRLGFIVDRYFSDLLNAAALRGKPLNTLVELVNDKLRLLSEEQIATLWSYLLREFSEERGEISYPRDSSRLPDGFFDFKSTQELRTKITKYIVNYRPLIIYDQLQRGVESIPLDLFGIGRILAFSKSPETEIGDAEECLARCLSRIRAYLERVSSGSSVDFLEIVKVAKNGRIAEGPDYRTAKDAIPTDRKVLAKLLGRELQHLVLAIRATSAGEQPVLNTLRRYQLGLEFGMPESRQAMRGWNEKRLQRHLRKYLVEHGIYSFGTDFGRSQADAFIQEYPESYVIEVKRFTNRGATRSALRRALVELQNYMNNVAGPRRGILVLYAFTPPFVVQPSAWISGRYWILPVNLISETPSEQKASLVIEETKDGDLIEVLKTGEADKPRGSIKHKNRTTSRKDRRNGRGVR